MVPSDKTLAGMRPQIARDWREAFPELGGYKPLWLARRIGPVVQGLVLDRNGANDAYAPTHHLHCLARPFPTVALAPGGRVASPASGAEIWVRAPLHARDFPEAARAVREQTLLSFDVPPTGEEIARAYRRFVSEGPGWGRVNHGFRGDLASILAWYGHENEAVAALVDAAREMRGWEARSLPEGGPSAWLDRERARIADLGAMRATVGKQIREHRLEKVPLIEARPAR